MDDPDVSQEISPGGCLPLDSGILPEVELPPSSIGSHGGTLHAMPDNQLASSELMQTHDAGIKDPPRDPDSHLSPETTMHTSIPALISEPRPLSDQCSDLPCRFFLDICSGSTRPLSTAVLQHGHCVLSFDILLDQRMNLLSDQAYEDLLKVCASGQVAYGAASPSCNEYSRLKLREDGGPKALRTPEFLQGRPDLTAAELQKVQESFLMLFRCVTCLLLIFQSGGHCHLEQPANAMSWLEKVVRHFLRAIGASCIYLAACAYGLDVYKAWMFASSFSPLRALGAVCTHGSDAHRSVQGQFDTFGNFASRATACYPADLASAFAKTIAPLLLEPTAALDLSLDSIHKVIPLKSLHDFPFASTDGGGYPSNPDWSQGDRLERDWFHSLRTEWLRHIIDQRLDKQLLAHLSLGKSTAPFQDDQLQFFRTSLDKFLVSHAQVPDWSVREHQPMYLHILHSLQLIMQDRDVALFPSLLAGVKTGFLGDIPHSNVFPENLREQCLDTPLTVHWQNWSSADDDIVLTRQLVQEELDQGWAFEYAGSFEQAQRDYPVGVALGKLGVATAEGRQPRLVVDSSVCGLNSRCQIPDRSTLPTAKEVLRCFPLRQTSSNYLGFSLDIKAAHKRIVLHPSEWGLVGFTLDEKIYFYRVTPFGATFSAAWWSRLGGWFLRFFHHLIWMSHAGFLYVDDFLFFMDSNMMPLIAVMLCIFAQLTGIPISWKKSVLDRSVDWIGWRFNFYSGIISIPEAKLEKFGKYISALLRNPRNHRKNLEKFIGLTMWLTQLFPVLRIWLHYLYQDLFHVPATHYSLDPGQWPALSQHLSDQLVFISSPPGSAIPLNSKLVSVRHQQVQAKSDLPSVRVPTEKRIWLRIQDPASSKRILRADSIRILHMFQHWMTDLIPIRPMRPKIFWPGEAAADACAAGQSCQIGGYIKHLSGQRLWFSERFCHDDFAFLPFSIDPDLQKSISALETLAQIALIFIVSTMYSGCRMPICLKSLSDNSGAESVGNKMFSTSQPMCYFLEVLSALSAKTCIELDVGHIPGPQNIIADDLSRWSFEPPIPHQFQESERIRIRLQELWKATPSVNLYPHHASLLWQLPTSV